MKHPRSKAQRSSSTVQLTDDEVDFLNRKLAAQRGEVVVSRTAQEEVRAMREEGSTTKLEYCSATLEKPDIRTCSRYKAISDEGSFGVCRERCTAWVLMKTGT